MPTEYTWSMNNVQRLKKFHTFDLKSQKVNCLCKEMKVYLISSYKMNDNADISKVDNPIRLVKSESG